MTPEEAKQAIGARIEIPESEVAQFWADYDVSQKSAVARYSFWKDMAIKYPQVKEGTWQIDGNVFRPALGKLKATPP